MKFLTKRSLALAAAAALAAAGAGALAAGPAPAGTAEAGSVPDGILYTGTLSQNGLPVNGSKPMSFKLYEASAGGTSLWQSTQSIVFEAGRFNALLPVSTGVLSGGAARWLEIEIEGTVLSPREALTSHPYALVARTVEGSLDISGGGLAVSSAAGAGAALYVSSQTGRVGVGTAVPAARLDVAGDIRSTGTVVAMRFDAAQAAVTGSIFTVGGTGLGVSAAGVGVGLAAPDRLLSAAGSVSQTGILVSSGAGANIFLGSVAIGTSAAQSRLTVLDGDIRMTAASARSLIFPDGSSMNTGGGGITSADSLAHPGDALAVSGAGRILLRTGAVDKITVAAGGNVGIAVASPAVLLDVSTSARFGSAAARSGFSAGGLLELAPGATVASAGTLSLSTAASAGATSIPALFIDAAGRVGLATAAPSSLLHVDGDIRAEGSLRLGGESLLRAAGAALLEFGSRNAVDLQLVAGSPGPGVYVAGTGLVGFGTATPRGLLHVASGTVDALLAGASGVGIGTSNPLARLHVSSGAIEIIGPAPALRVGQALTVAGGRVGVGATAPTALFQVGASTLAAKGGRVGVLTNFPEADLDVAGSASFGSGAARSTFTSSGLLQIAGDLTAGTINGGILLANPMSPALTVNSSPGLDTTRPGITLSTGLFISSGRVGVGTTRPATGIHVSSANLIVDGAGGSLLVGNSTFSAAAGRIGLGTANPATLFHMSSGTLTMDGAAPVLSVGISTFVITTGRIGVGTSRPGTRFHVSSGTLAVDGAGAGLQVGGNALAALGGKVGIGTSSPALLLDVNGSARFGPAGSKAVFPSGGGMQLPAGSTMAWSGTISFSTALSAALTQSPVLFTDRRGRTGLGTGAPKALLSVGAPLPGTVSTFVAVNAGTLAAPEGSTLGIGNFRFTAGADNVALALRGRRRAVSPADATTASLGLALDFNGLQQGASLWLTAGGLVGIGTAAPEGRLHVHAGDVRITTTTGSRGVIFADATVQTKAAGSAQWVANQEHLYAGNLGYIGMGTTAPQAKLDIGGGKIRMHPDASLAAPAAQSSARIDVGLASLLGDCPMNSSYLYYDSGAGSWRSTTGNRAGFAWGACGTDAWSVWTLAPAPGTAGTLVSPQTRLTVTYQGKVGIGTTAPGVNLAVEDPAGPVVSLKRDSSNLWYAGLSPSGSDRMFLRAGGNNEQDERLSLLTTGLVGFGTISPKSLLSVAGGIAVGSYAGVSAPPSGGLILSGRVGVGLTNPAVPLDVTGTQAMGIRYIRSSRDARISLADSGAGSGSWSLAAGWFGNGDLSIISDSGSEANRIYFKQGGNIGIGTTSPLNRLSVNGGMALGTYAGVNTAPANSLIVSGNVGVGTTDPDVKLQVAGEIRSTDAAGNTRLWGEGRPGARRYGKNGDCSVMGDSACGLCNQPNSSVKYGLSLSAVRWSGAAAACPFGTWVCNEIDRCGVVCFDIQGQAPDANDVCNTTRPDTDGGAAYDAIIGSGTYANMPSDAHLGYFADFAKIAASTDTASAYISEQGTKGYPAGDQAETSTGVWCCSE